MKTKIQSGFTLVEIMIVVAIIGMLASIAIPSYVKARMKAQKVSCINNLQIIDGAVQQWALDTGKSANQAVQYANISGYLQHQVVCPAGGTRFEDSYQLTTVEAPCVCLKSPDGEYAHRLAQ